ncbi:polar amino acid transport system substrate-binding protein [Chitinivorax tropicus]|uniref:Polar amino acid transport system substrate-binding protein n=1 Tax=Chitinivorax tropicus TaxID=714531 RepID=A0A840MJ97_9PROT|nr:transporter substrate-binding domain-containing protein [Chitinivorax tropicus]MBB5019274.1 polar amino acid transport system substrate-binding protein [Chitinivorax tropicus]
MKGAAYWSALLYMAAFSSGWADDKTITLTSLEWPPYTGQALQNQGASAAVAKAAFEAMGYKLKIEFYPWSRAVGLVKTSKTHMGYFPEYHSTDNAKTFHYSDPIGKGPLGFAERADAPISWSRLSDLASKKIGVVQDYVNTDEFDGMVAAKQLKVDVATDDSKNLLKLGGGRIDLAVVDQNVMNYLLSNDKDLKSLKGKLKFNGKLLEDKNLFICFKKGPEGEKLAKLFNDGLKKINVDQIMGQHLK